MAEKKLVLNEPSAIGSNRGSKNSRGPQAQATIQPFLPRPSTPATKSVWTRPERSIEKPRRGDAELPPVSREEVSAWVLRPIQESRDGGGTDFPPPLRRRGRLIQSSSGRATRSARL